MNDTEKKAWEGIVHAASRPVMMDGARSPNQRAILAADAELQRLRAALAEKEAQLCRAREEWRRKRPHTPEQLAKEVDEAFSTTAPCPHEEEAKRLENRLALAEKVVECAEEVARWVTVGEIKEIAELRAALAAHKEG